MQIDEAGRMTDQQILDQLREVGISLTLEEFKEVALKAGSPSELWDQWTSRHGVKRIFEDFLYQASRELWKRHLGDVKRAEAAQDSIYDLISYYDGIKDHNRDSLIKIYKGIEKFHSFCFKEDGTDDVKFYKEVKEDDFDEIESFLLAMPLEFARYGLIDEAINVGKWFADLSDQPENFYRDMGCILAEAGRKEEAIKQVEENLKRFPEDIWVIINAGDAFYSLGDRKSEEFFLKAYGMAGDNDYDKAGALERLIDFYRWQGTEEKAKAFEEEYELVTAPPQPKTKRESKLEPEVNSKKIGRNDPCPCGSGKKYKKCCLSKEAI